MALAAALFALGILHGALAPLAAAGQAFFFVNYLPENGHGSGLPIPLWSLAVKERFYLLFPISLGVAMKRFAPRRIAAALVVLCGVVLLVRLFNIYALHFVEMDYYWTHTRIDSILFGCVLALASNPVVEARSWRPPLWALAAALLAILATFAIRTIPPSARASATRSRASPCS